MKILILTAIPLLALLGACGSAKPGDASDAPSVLPASCQDEPDLPPRSLVCTGLYSDVSKKLVAPGLVWYAPAVSLWSDGAEKQRWIELPKGDAIDDTDPNEWIFPIGTKVWKEFSRGGGRVETRLWQKVHAGYWVSGTYSWNADESAADLSSGGDITIADGTIYHVPTQDECQKCHRGRTDRILGFDQVLLGLPEADGLTLNALAQQGALTVPPASTTLTIGDDGTGAAAPALAWLHVNCGTIVPQRKFQFDGLFERHAAPTRSNRCWTNDRPPTSLSFRQLWASPCKPRIGVAPSALSRDRRNIACSTSSSVTEARACRCHPSPPVWSMTPGSPWSDPGSPPCPRQRRSSRHERILAAWRAPCRVSSSMDRPSTARGNRPMCKRGYFGRR